MAQQANKPMPYTPWEHAYDPQLHDRLQYVPPSSPEDWYYDFELDRELNSKTLTEAECAAEYWRAFTIFNAVASGGIAGDPIAANHQLDVWHRFATTPAAEVDE